MCIYARMLFLLTSVDSQPLFLLALLPVDTVNALMHVPSWLEQYFCNVLHVSKNE